MDDIYWAHEVLLTEVLNDRALIKEKTVKTKQTQFMNSKLRKAVFKKSMVFNKYKTWRTPANWEAYRMQRNLCSKLKRQSIRHYFSERCAGGPKSKDFWATVKPFLSNKGLLKDPVIILSENDNIISNQICCEYTERVLCKCRPRHIICTYPGWHIKPPQHPKNNIPHPCSYCF